MATSSVVIPSTRRGWSGHVTVHSRAVKSRIPNRSWQPSLTRSVLETKLSPPVRPFPPRFAGRAQYAVSPMSAREPSPGHRRGAPACCPSSPTGTSASASSSGSQASAGPSHHRDDDVPRDGYDLLAGAGGDRDQGVELV